MDVTGRFTDDSNLYTPSSATQMGVQQAIMSLLVWLKLLYFLRIFESTQYLIRIIIQVGIDMKYFLLMLALTYFSFGEAVQSINLANYELDRSNCERLLRPQDVSSCLRDLDPNGFTGLLGGFGYQYRMALGDFSLAEEGIGRLAVPFMWILFILSTVLNMIKMLNLLIAIISESFSNINSVAL